jgi:hypothetical protein
VFTCATQSLWLWLESADACPITSLCKHCVTPIPREVPLGPVLVQPCLVCEIVGLCTWLSCVCVTSLASSPPPPTHTHVHHAHPLLAPRGAPGPAMPGSAVLVPSTPHPPPPPPEVHLALPSHTASLKLAKKMCAAVKVRDSRCVSDSCWPEEGPA